MTLAANYKDKWDRFLTGKKFSELFKRAENTKPKSVPAYADQNDIRLPQERDHDRILFSTPFRRLGDKTQVFPLDSIESIRTRLTHSYEVANLARSIGVTITNAEELKDKLPDKACRIIPAILAAAGLAHDIGNPPFGHQGEAAIRAWFKRNEKLLYFRGVSGTTEEQCKNDFLEFEGNAQTLRVLTKLQVISDDLGLNLTCGTITAVMKYIVPSHKADKRHSNSAFHKPGFFFSEMQLVKRAREEAGLVDGQRHPLALIMEACDDIAYSVLDIEDSIKKGFLSYSDLITAIRLLPEGNEERAYLLEYDEIEQKRHNEKLAPKERQDVLMQMFRVHAIHLMICAVVKTFLNNYDSIMKGTFRGELTKESPVNELCKKLKELARENAFKTESVLALELNGFNIINELMDWLWIGIHERSDAADLASGRKTPFANYAYGRISQNYKRLFENSCTSKSSLAVYHDEQRRLPIRYLELQLLTDMISGMTDQFCIDLHADLKRLYKHHEAVS